MPCERFSWKLSRGFGILGKTTLSFEKTDVFADTTKLHLLNHRRDYLSVRGHLNIARPPQGYPVLVQAGASESGIRFAAGQAEVVFTAEPSDSRDHFMIVGTPDEIASAMLERVDQYAADGFNILPATVPGELKDSIELVVPELRRRGKFRSNIPDRP
ncbi:alkanesulfonate monooxygenase SsuD/methylene tetrahydromethanopterin reductase-like flavin-dependent oxidoreductase (luciferase family) [Bradyrhizobium sp. GM24.11]